MCCDQVFSFLVLLDCNSTQVDGQSFSLGYIEGNLKIVKILLKDTVFHKATGGVPLILFN